MDKSTTSRIRVKKPGANLLKLPFITVLTVFLLLVFSNCKRQPKESDIIHLPQEIYDYVMFPVGSYWVYQDSISGVKDSLSLDFQQVIEKQTSNLDAYYDRLEQTFTSSIRGNIYSSAYLSVKDPAVYEYCNSIGSFSAPTENVIMLGGNVSSSDSLTINNITFFNIKMFTSGNGSVTVRSFWAYHIGLIRYENSEDTTVYNIVNYYINN